MINCNDLKKKNEEIEKEVENYYREKYKEEFEEDFVLDGIIDVDKYCQSKYKILWILKEPWGGGNWTFKCAINNPKNRNKMIKGHHATWRKIIYATYGILENSYWDDMDDYKDISDVLRNIAIININKIPRNENSKSNNKEIEKVFNNDYEILIKQIDFFNPDIIIGGNTLHYFGKKLDIKWENNNSIPWYSKKSSRLYIHTYHPAYLRIKDEKYVDSIVNIVREQFK